MTNDWYEIMELSPGASAEEIVLGKPPRDLSGAFAALARLPDDFLADRNDGKMSVALPCRWPYLAIMHLLGYNINR